MLDLDAGSAALVSRAPENDELFARFDRPSRCREVVRDANREATRLRIDDVEHQPRANGLAEAILRLEHRTIDARLEAGADQDVCRARGVGGERFFDDERAQLPGVRIRWFGFRLRFTSQCEPIQQATRC